MSGLDGLTEDHSRVIRILKRTGRISFATLCEQLPGWPTAKIQTVVQGLIADDGPVGIDGASIDEVLDTTLGQLDGLVFSREGLAEVNLWLRTDEGVSRDWLRIVRLA